ncbi:MAG: hypothetical protein OXD36_18480, partial [Rhodobacter sp.]|nr:hypothetical protein [Rhodobacter sp.]
MNASVDGPGVYLERGRNTPRIPPRRLRIFQSILGRVESGEIEVELPDGGRIRAVGREPGPCGKLTVLNPRFFGRLLAEGDLGFGEMYVERWWTTPDLQSLLDVILLNNGNMAREFPGTWLFRLRERLLHLLNANSRKGSRRN